MARITREKFKTMHTVFDNHAERIIFKLISEGHFDGLIGPISMGKEANVFAAQKGTAKVVLKIYRLENCDYNRMYDHIRFDSRYLHLKKKRRMIIFSWCQREFRNLIKAREAGVPVPTPITFSDNVLVMEHIGIPDPAPKLKDAQPKSPEKFLHSLIKALGNYYAAGMVHGDLSEFNILNNNEKPVLIDLSQATPLKSMNSAYLLHRDMHNLARYFSKIGLETSAAELEQAVVSFSKKKGE